jgi:hypothetical protein
VEANLSSFKDYDGTPFLPYLLPIIPAGPKTVLSHNLKLMPDRIGKIPGLRNPDGSWSGFARWPSNTFWGSQIPATQHWYDGYRCATIGIQAREFPGVDSDVEDERAAAIVDWNRFLHLRTAPRRGRPNSNKCLWMYRLKAGTAPIRKRRLAFRHPSDPDRIMAVEVLADGQHYIIEGEHPSGVLYEWNKGPLDWGYDNLQEIDNAAVNAFIIACREDLVAAGYELVKGNAVGLASGNTSGPRSPIGPDHPDQCPDLALLADLLRHCPCDAPQFASRDAWVEMLAAIKAACAGDEGFYEEHVWPWCSTYPENEPDYVRGVWESIEDSALGWSYLCSVSQEFNWQGLVRYMFEDLEGGDPVSGAEASPSVPKRNAPVPQLIPADFDLRKLPRRPFVLGNRFMAGVVTLGVGPAGTGKSNLAILAGLSIASGQSLTGEPVYRSGRVWIHNNEEPIDELYRRIGGILEHHQIPLSAVRENIFVTSGLDTRLVIALKSKDVVKRGAAVEEMIASIQAKGIIHLVVDPLVSTHRGVSENSNEEMEQVAEAIRHIAHQTNCSIDLIHHTLKAGKSNSEAQAGDMNAARGASALIGAVRMVYTLSPMSERTASQLHVSSDIAHRLVRLDHAKGNYTARDARTRWFELEPYSIENGPDAGDVFGGGDTMAVPKPWSSETETTAPAVEGKDDKAAQREAKLQRVRDVVAAAMTSGRCKAKDIFPAIEQEFLVKDATARKLLKEAVPEDADGAPAEARGCPYLLSLSRQGKSAPHPMFIVRSLVTEQAMAA